MNNRKTGFYWIKHESDDFWEVAYWDGEYFRMAICGKKAWGGMIYNINEEPIPPPKD